MTHKLKCDREMLADKLKKCYSFIPEKQIIPQWENFKLTIASNIMEILASDGVMQIKMFCPVESKTDFAICVPAGLLLKTVNDLFENEITISQKSDTKIEIKSGKSKCNITLDCFPEHFSTLQIREISSEINMNQFMLKMALKSAGEFVDEKHTNANLTAINVNEINNKIVFFGCTKVLFCRVSISPISINAWQPVNILVNTAKKVSKLLSDKGEIGVAHCVDKIKFFTDNESPDHFEITSVTSNTKYPNAENIFNKVPENSINVNTIELKKAVKLLYLYGSTGTTTSVFVSNEENSQELILLTQDAVTGKHGEVSISIINPTNVIIKKSFINEQLIQLLSEIDTAETTIYFNEADAKTPSFFIPKVNTEEDNIYCFIVASAF